MSNYYVYDGRAHQDIDSACLLECFVANNDTQAKRHFNRKWKDVDAVLLDDAQDVVYNG